MCFSYLQRNMVNCKCRRLKIYYGKQLLMKWPWNNTALQYFAQKIYRKLSQN